jgi:hypothetical protein
LQHQQEQPGRQVANRTCDPSHWVDLKTDLGIDLGIDLRTDLGIDLGIDLRTDLGIDLGIDLMGVGAVSWELARSRSGDVHA